MFASLLMGALVGEVDFGDLEANLYFCSALLVVKSISLTLRHVLFASLLMGALVGEVDFGDLEANLFFAVRFLWRGRSF